MADSDSEPTDIPNVLACDVGNSAVHFAHVSGEEVTPVHAIALSASEPLADALAALWDEIPQPKAIVACSVNPRGLKCLEDAAAKSIRQSVLVVGRDLPLPIQTDLPHPDKIGPDRLCAAVAAFDRLGVACVVADYGTAVTIDCVNDEGLFLGGAILPGLALSARSLHAETSLLPVVELSNPTWVFGKDTRQAIVGGLVFGARAILRELTEAYATELTHWPIVIITGGDAKLVCPDPNASELVQAIVPDLVLRGVAMAYYKTLVK